MRASVAARWTSWVAAGSQRNTASGDRSAGQPFLPGVFGSRSRILVEAAIGANLAADITTWNWIDITADVFLPARISITQGRTDNTSTAQPGACGFTLRNDAGDYTPYNPAGRWYPNIRRGTPVRVSLDLDLGTGPVVVYQGAVASFTPTWDVTARLPLVAVECGGTTRRLAQGKTPLRSALYRASSNRAGLVAYWPMEDGTDATSFASAAGGKPLVSASANKATFADAGPGGSLPLPRLTAAYGTGGCVYTGRIQLPAAGGPFCINVVARISDPNISHPLVTFTTADGAIIQMMVMAKYRSGVNPGFEISVPRNNDSSGLLYTSLNDGGWHLYQCTFVQTGADIHVGIWLDGVGSFSNFFTAITLGAPRNITLGQELLQFADATFDLDIGHVSVRTVSDATVRPDFNSLAVSGYTGETATDRLVRVCGEQGMALSAVGTSNITMGPQPVAALMDILREPETADIGFLYDGFNSGLGYRSRSSWYNRPAAFTIDVAARQLSVPLAPVDDDQRLRNDATASRSGGSNVPVVDTDGALGTAAVGTYDTSVTVNVDSDAVLDDIAGWVVRLGTVPGLRYPALNLDLAAVPALAGPWINAGPPGFRVDVVNIDSVATQHPPDDVALIVEGWTMTLSPYLWSLTANCSPADPYTVPVLNDPVLGKLGTNSTSQHDGWDGVSGSFTIDTATGPLWSTDPAQYPVDLNCGGQRVTVTGCAGGANPQTLTVGAASVNGVAKTHPAGEAVTLWMRLRPAL